MKRGLILLVCGVLLAAAGRAAAQDPAAAEDMRFLKELRGRGDGALALKYLKRISENATGDLAKQLPLELARTGLEAAGEEPDSAKRLTLYGDSRVELQKWLEGNANSPEAGSVKLDVARVAMLQGKTQLGRYLSQDPAEAQMSDALKARAQLADAGAELQKAAKDLDAQLEKLKDPKTPAEKDQKKALENARLEAELNIGVNLYDQALTYPANAGDAASKEHADKVNKAITILEKLSNKDDTNPICWQARAWVGRCLHENGESVQKVRGKFAEIIDTSTKNPAAVEGQRLARYFRLLFLKHLLEHNEAEKNEGADYIIERARGWIKDYPTSARTPEGYGTRFLLAQVLATEVNDPKLKDEPKKQAMLAEARTMLRQVEQSENDFTDRARRLKVQVMYKQQNGFTEKIEKLTKFEDCYVRAQYEMMQINEDEKKIRAAAEKDKKQVDEKELEKNRQAHLTTVTAALERALDCPDAKSAAKGEMALDLNNARALLTFNYMNAQKYKEAIRVGEGFARSDPGAAQAAMAAVYALQAYAEMLEHDEQSAAKDLEENRKKMLALAEYAEQRWPTELPGDLARHQLSLYYIRQKDDNGDGVRKAIDALSRISPNYASYTIAQYQLAQYALDADKNKVPPIPNDYRKRALAALEGLQPPPAGAEPTVNKVFFLGKIKLGQELFKEKKYDEMVALTDALMPKLGALKLDAVEDSNAKLHEQFAENIKDFRLYGLWAKADAEAKAGHFDKVMAMLDPVVDEITKNQHTQLKDNPALARGILDNALRAAIQLNKTDRTKAVLSAYPAFAPAGTTPDAGAAEILKQLVVFIPPQLDELRRKGDAKALEKAKAEFSEILDAQIKPLGDKITPKLAYFISQIYSSLDKHKEAAEMLGKVPEAAKDADMGTVQLDHSIRVLLARERRLSKDVEGARKLLDAIMGTKKDPGWGHSNIDVLVEHVYLLGDEGRHKEAAEFANGLLQKMLPKIEGDPKMKERYMECYYLMVNDAYRQAGNLKEKDAVKYAKGVKLAAGLIVDLVKKQQGFGGDASRKRFQELLEAEPDLKDAFLAGFAAGIETGVKEANVLKDKTQKEKAFLDLGTDVYELEKMWPDFGGADPKQKITDLLGDEGLKAGYDKAKASS